MEALFYSSRTSWKPCDQPISNQIAKNPSRDSLFKYSAYPVSKTITLEHLKPYKMPRFYVIKEMGAFSSPLDHNGKLFQEKPTTVQ